MRLVSGVSWSQIFTSQRLLMLHMNMQIILLSPSVPSALSGLLLSWSVIHYFLTVIEFIDWDTDKKFLLCDCYILAFQINDGLSHLHWRLFGPHILTMKTIKTIKIQRSPLLRESWNNINRQINPDPVKTVARVLPALPDLWIWFVKF